MESAPPIPPISMDSIVINELTSQKPTTLLLHTNRPYLYNYWTLNERLKVKNEKLLKRQQSSCRIAFYSLWLCIIAGVMCIVIYRFTDECPLTTNRKQFFMKCLRYWLFLAAICISLLACSGVIFGACRYFRSEPHTFFYGNEHELHLTNNNDLLPKTTASYSYCYPTSLIRSTSIRPSRQIQNLNDEHSNTTVISSVANTSPRHKIPPFDYDELPPEPNPIIIRKSPNITNNNKTILFSSSTSTSLSSPQSIFSTTIPSYATNTITNSNKNKTIPFFEDTYPSTPASYTTCISEVDVWEKQQRLSSLR